MHHGTRAYVKSRVYNTVMNPWCRIISCLFCWRLTKTVTLVLAFLLLHSLTLVVYVLVVNCAGMCIYVCE